MSGRLVGAVTRTKTGLTPLEKLVFVIIAEHIPVDGDGIACPAVSTIAAHAEASERSVQRALKTLLDRQFVRIVGDRGVSGSKYSSTHYAIIETNLGGDTRVTPNVVELPTPRPLPKHWGGRKSLLKTPVGGDTRVTPKKPGGDIQGILGVTRVSPKPVRTTGTYVQSRGTASGPEPPAGAKVRHDPPRHPSQNRKVIVRLVHIVYDKLLAHGDGRLPEEEIVELVKRAVAPKVPDYNTAVILTAMDQATFRRLMLGKPIPKHAGSRGAAAFRLQHGSKHHMVAVHARRRSG